MFLATEQNIFHFNLQLWVNRSDENINKSLK